MKKSLLALMLLAGSSAFAATRFSIGVQVGPSYGYYPAPPPPPVVAYRPVSPGPGYSWISGYYYPVGQRYQWRRGYWARPPYRGAVWVAPRYSGQRYYGGYWRRR